MCLALGNLSSFGVGLYQIIHKLALHVTLTPLSFALTPHPNLIVYYDFFNDLSIPFLSVTMECVITVICNDSLVQQVKENVVHVDINDFSLRNLSYILRNNCYCYLQLGTEFCMYLMAPSRIISVV